MDANMDEYSEEEEDYVSGSCIHIDNYKSEFQLDDYRHLYSFYVACITEDSLKRKVHDCVCRVQSCKTKRTRIHACLYCIYFGCLDIKESKRSHIYLHARDNSHPLGMDTDSGRVYCFECNDYKYDFDFERISEEVNLITSHHRGITTCAAYKWEPNLDELNLLKWHEIVYDSESDIRGFSNIQKSICFLICIVQSLIHAPVFRDYLLSFKHKCKLKSKSDYPTCFICEMTKIVQECFSGKSKPYEMIDFMILLKDRAGDYATTELHDAEEFFVSLLSKLCEDCEESATISCNCIIHTIFEFSFHTERTCDKCQNVKISAEQSTWDIMLTTGGKSVLSLTDCLKRFLLGDISNRCPKCSYESGTSKFVLKRLPIVLTFCLNLDFLAKKGKYFIEYKEFLNIAPENFAGGEEVDVNADKEEKLSPEYQYPEYQYYLFAVVQYVPGHYITYIRKDKNNWYCCDNENTKPKTLKEILKIRARMLFYHKQFM